MTWHIRLDGAELNADAKMVCGIGWPLPEGDKWVGEGESGLHHRVDCQGCNPNPRPLGTPLSELSGRPGHDGYGEFARIAASWGYE